MSAVYCRYGLYFPFQFLRLRLFVRNIGIFFLHFAPLSSLQLAALEIRSARPFRRGFLDVCGKARAVWQKVWGSRAVPYTAREHLRWNLAGRCHGDRYGFVFPPGCGGTNQDIQVEYFISVGGGGCVKRCSVSRPSHFLR